MPLPEGFTCRPASLDFAAVLTMGTALCVDLHLLAEVLPDVEHAILHPADGVEIEEDDDGNDNA